MNAEDFDLMADGYQKSMLLQLNTSTTTFQCNGANTILVRELH